MVKLIPQIFLNILEADIHKWQLIYIYIYNNNIIILPKHIAHFQLALGLISVGSVRDADYRQNWRGDRAVGFTVNNGGGWCMAE